MRFVCFLGGCVFLLACNLTQQVAITPIPTDDPDATAIDTDAPAGPTALPGVDVNPGPGNSAPTRTPVGTVQPATLGVTSSSADPLPTSETGERASITSPANGSTLFTGTIEISGVVSNLPDDEFQLALVTGSGVPVNEQTITVNNPNNVADVPWTAAMTVSRYTGPAQLRVSARNRNGEMVLLARLDITMAEGDGAGGSLGGGGGSANADQTATTPTGSITTPADGSTVAGGTLLVSGTAGGFRGEQFNLELVANDGSVLASTPITISSSDYTRIVPWAGSVGTGGYTGPAEIRATVTVNGQVITFASASITLQ